MIPIRTQIANAIRRRDKAIEAVKATTRSEKEAREEATLELDDSHYELSLILSAHSELFSEAWDTRAQLSAVTKERDELLQMLSESLTFMPNFSPGGRGIEFVRRVRERIFAAADAKAAAALQPGDDA